MIDALLLAAVVSLPPQASDATIGVTAIHLESGRRVSVRGSERFPMGSVYKFPIGIVVLHHVDGDKLSLEQKVTVEPDDFADGWSPLRDESKGATTTRTVGELLELMVSMSDNTACDVLLDLIGGPEVVTATIRELGIRDIRVDRSEKRIGADIGAKGVSAYGTDPRDTATPDAMAELLLAFAKEEVDLSPASHALLLRHLIESPTGERKLRAAAPQGWVVAHKSGMMPQTSNDVGILISPDGDEHIIIAIFARQSTSEYATIDRDIAAAVRATIAVLREDEPRKTAVGK